MPKSQRYGLIALCWICSVIVIGYLVGNYRNPDGDGFKDTFHKVLSNYKDGKKKYFGSDSHDVESFQFDPNTADSTQLEQLGLTAYQIRCIYGFRRKGYRYHEPDDFRGVPDLTYEQWEHLRPLIYIDPKYRVIPRAPRHYNGYQSGDTYSEGSHPGDSNTHRKDSIRHYRDSVRNSYPKKFTGDEVVDVNTCDSATLCRIPGIGKYYASQIMRYRRQLGGFVDVRQLLEIENFPADALTWMSVEKNPQIKKLDINHMTKRQMSRHPYIRFYRAEEIDNYRRIHGSLQSVDNLRQLPHFSEQDIRRLAPYLEFK